MTKKKIPEGYTAAKVEFIAPANVVERIMAAVNDAELARRLQGDPHHNSGVPLGAPTVAAVALLRGVEALQACYFPEPYIEEHPETPRVYVDLSVHGASALRYFALVGIEAEPTPWDSSSPMAATRAHGRSAAEALDRQVRRASWEEHVHEARLPITEKAAKAKGAALVLSDEGARLHYRLQGERVQEDDTLEIFLGDWVTATFHWSGVMGERPQLLNVPGLLSVCPHGIGTAKVARNTLEIKE